MGTASMIRTLRLAAIIVFALVLGASSALAAKSPHRYSPKHGAKCRKSYKRVRHGKKVYCVKKAAKKAATPTPTAPAPTTEKVKLHAHLDPSYTRDPMDPFQVTYAYSASATQQTFSAADLAIGGEGPAPLPSGVLSFYSDGKLECAVNVGSGVEGSECPVTYQALGEHRVTTIYSSGEQSATETEVEDIGPLATETTLSVSYEKTAPVEVGVASGLWRIGTLVITAEAQPSSLHAAIGCGSGASLERVDGSGCYDITAPEQFVYAAETGNCASPELGHLFISHEHPEPGESGGAGKVSGEALTAEALESGTDHLRASVMSSGGYTASEAGAPIQFTPEVTFPPDC